MVAAAPGGYSRAWAGYLGDYGLAFRQRVPYESMKISAFACYFGQSQVDIKVVKETHTISAATVQRDAAACAMCAPT